MNIRKYVRRMLKRIVPLKLFCKLTGDFYSENFHNAQKTIFKDKKLMKNYETEIKYMKKEGGLVIFPYEFCENYDSKKIEVYLNEKENMHYVLHNDKELYFPRNWSVNRIRDYYNGLLIEQDIESPHRYFTNNFQVEEGDVFVDVGCAEAMSSLDCIDTASLLYLFECDQKWLEALELTFRNYKDKVRIISKYVRDYNDHESITLEKALADSLGKTFFIKLDLSGYEWDVLNASPEFLNSQRIKCAGCTYHRHGDEEILMKNLSSSGFDCEFSNGVMLFIFSELKYPYFRKGLVRGKNF